MSDFTCIRGKVRAKTQHQKVLKVYLDGNGTELLMFRTDYTHMMNNVARHVIKKMCLDGAEVSDATKSCLKFIVKNAPVFLPEQCIAAYCTPFQDKKCIKQVCVYVPSSHDQIKTLKAWKQKMLVWLYELRKRISSPQQADKEMNPQLLVCVADAVRILSAFDLDGAHDAPHPSQNILWVLANAAAHTPHLSIFSVLYETYRRLDIFTHLKKDVESMCRKQKMPTFSDQDILKLSDLCDDYTRFCTEPFAKIWCAQKSVSCFEPLDRFASILQHDMKRRVLANAFQTLVEEMMEKGHMCLPVDQLVELVVSRMGKKLLDEAQREAFATIDVKALLLHTSSRRLFHIYVDAHDDIEWVYIARVFEKESFLVKKIQDLTCIQYRDSKHIDRANKILETDTSIDFARLHHKQQRVLKDVICMKRGVYVLTGLPGTGKSVVIQKMHQLAQRLGLMIGLCAPTGKAATRLGRDAMTIHRMLGACPNDEGDEIQLHAELSQYDILILDESSMIDFELFYSLVKACRRDMVLLFVGDNNQLPSVGYGDVFQALVDMPHIIPRVHLTKIYRQTEENSTISLWARYIKKGIVPPLEIIHDQKETYFTRERDPERIKQAVWQTYIKYRQQNKDCVVLSPMRRGFLGTDVLNRYIHERLYPNNRNEIMSGERIMITHNLYKKREDGSIDPQNSAMNGDMGSFDAYAFSDAQQDDDERNARVWIDDVDRNRRLITLPVDTVTLAHACNTHKMQGNDAPVIILVMNSYQKRMLNQKMFYTSVTRAREKIHLIGDDLAIATAIQTPCAERFCLIAERVKNL